MTKDTINEACKIGNNKSITKDTINELMKSLKYLLDINNKNDKKEIIKLIITIICQ